MGKASQARSASRMSPCDLAYAALKEHGQPLSSKDLIDRVLTAMGVAAAERARAAAAVFTDINLDTRFHHAGGGMWSLREWSPRPSVRVVPLSPVLRSRREDQASGDPDEAVEADGEEYEYREDAAAGQGEDDDSDPDGWEAHRSYREDE